MDARTYFLMLHEEAHFTGKARRVFEVPTPEQWRAVLPGHNSIAWCVWHIAYGEDWGIAALRGDETLMRRDGWEGRLGVRLADLRRADDRGRGGAGRSGPSTWMRCGTTTERSTTRRAASLRTSTSTPWTRPLEPQVYDHALDLLAGDEFMRTSLESWTAPRDYLNIMALMDVYYHLDEADHMVRMLLPERQFT